MSDAQAAQATKNGAPAVEKTPAPTPGVKVFAGNLSFSTTDEGLKTFFAPVQSDILSVQIIHRRHRPAGYGFVAFDTEEAAKKAVETLNRQELDGRQVIVEIARPANEKGSTERRARRRTGRRGSKAVPGEVTEAEANGEAPKEEGAAPAEGEQKPKKKRRSYRKKKTAAAPAEGEAANEAPAAEGTEPVKKAPRARKHRAPRPPRPAGEDPAGEPSKNTVFVANLGFAVDDAALGDLFTDAGITVTSARIVRRRFGQPRRSKGYGFVDVGSEENQQKAIAALDGKEIGGRAIAVKVAVNTPREQERAEGEAKPADAAAAAPTPADAVPATPGPAASA